MRTNIVLDDELIERALQVTGLKTRREVVHEALRTLIRLHEQAEVRALRGALKKGAQPPRSGSITEQRIPLLHHDNDFDGCEAHLGLRVVHPEALS